MFVVTRGLTAAGMSVYAVIHFFQMASPPMESPTWLRVAYGLTAVAALVIAGGALFDERHHTWSGIGALLALGSAVALLLSVTVGFLGVVAADLQPAALVAIVAEMMAIGSWLALQVARSSSPEAAAEDAASERGGLPAVVPST